MSDVNLPSKCGQEIKARNLSSEELFMICSDLNINTSTENRNGGWQKMAFSLSLTDHKLLHKIGLEIGKGGSATVFIGEFAIYKKEGKNRATNNEACLLWLLINLGI